MRCTVMIEKKQTTAITKSWMQLQTIYTNFIAEQREVPGYKNLLNHRVSIFGTIDDHDYGTNNGDKTFRWKKENAIEFVKFLGLSETKSAMARRVHQGDGVYGVQVYNFSTTETIHLLSDEDAGLDPDVMSQEDYEYRQKEQNNNNTDSNKLVAIFVLDVRSNKTPWSKMFSERFSKYPDGDFLGEKQWNVVPYSNWTIYSSCQHHCDWLTGPCSMVL